MFWSQWFFKPPSKDQFAELVMAEFRRSGDHSKYTYDSSQFRLTNSAPWETNLANIYADYCALPRRKRSRYLRDVVASLNAAREDSPTLFEEARGNLRPKIWTRAAFSEISLRREAAAGGPIDIVSYPLGSHLISTVVYDFPGALRTIGCV